jgi:hypothetical protein
MRRPCSPRSRSGPDAAGQATRVPFGQKALKTGEQLQQPRPGQLISRHAGQSFFDAILQLRDDSVHRRAETVSLDTPARVRSGWARAACRATVPVMDPMRSRWWLQAQQTQAAQVLAAMASLDVPSAERWAARALQAARTAGHTSPESVVHVARLIALGRGQDIDAVQARQLAADHARVGARPSLALRDDAAARRDFNHPPHWAQDADGAWAPDAARMHNAVARSWSAISGKFGPVLARRLFDANVRGGALAVMAAMDAAGSTQTLTASDLAHLQYAAITDGGPRTAGVNANDPPSLHDAAHSIGAYGVSVQQEIHGDRFSEAVLNELFDAQPAFSINRELALDQQPAVARQLRQLVNSQHDELSLDDLLGELDLSFFTRTPDGQQLSHGWTESPRANAERAERILDANGLLAHLGAEERAEVLARIHGTGDATTFESIATRWAQSGDRARFTADVDAWLDDLADVLREVSHGSLMTRQEFTQRAARAIAFGLTLERAAPGSLVMGLLDAGVADADLMPALRTLDLRSAYPPVLREVQRALGVTP